MKKIVVIGPESTGKTTLTKQLGGHFNSPVVEEYARPYIDSLDRPYTKEDLLEIARGQITQEDKFQRSTAPYLFCDTDLRVINIWSSYKYGNTHPWITSQIRHREYHGYLLMDIDLPWQTDPQREHQHHRAELFDLYYADLKNSGVAFSIISGQGKKRQQSAIDFVLNLD